MLVKLETILTTVRKKINCFLLGIFKENWVAVYHGEGNTAKMTMFEKEIKLLVMAALRDNPDTCTQPIRVQVRGRNVMLSGLVANENVILEAIISVESVSEFLNVYSRLMVREAEATPVYRNVAATATV